MRYAVVSTWPAPNFVPFLRVLAASDDIVCVFTKPCDAHYIEDARRVLPRLLFPGPLNFRAAAGLVHALEAEGYQAAIVNGPSTRNYAYLAPLLRLRDVPVVMWTQEWLGPRVSIRRRLADPGLRALSRLATTVVAQGSRAAACSRNLGVAPNRVRLALLGSEVPSSMPLEDEPAPRSRFSILYVGRLIRLKGIHVLLEAVAGVLSRITDVGLTIVGEGPYRAELQATAARLGLRDRTCFAGSVPHERLAPYFAAADVFVLPSTYDWGAKEQLEIWGYVLFEAAHFGLPLIATDAVGAAPDVIPDDETGFVVRHGDVEGLSSALLRLASDRALRERLGEAARRRASTFTYEAAAARVRAAIAETIEFRSTASTVH